MSYLDTLMTWALLCGLTVAGTYATARFHDWTLRRAADRKAAELGSEVPVR